MKVLIFGSDKVWSIENFYVEYLAKHNVEVRRFAGQSLFYDYYWKNIFNKIKYKLGISRITKTINNKLLEVIKEFKPEILLVFKGMEITPKTLLTIKKMGIKLANYNPDNPFIFTGKGSGNSNITNALPLYDLHITYNIEIQQQLKQQLHIKTGFLPFGYNISDEIVEQVSSEEEVLKCCFLGNPDKDRAAFIIELAQNSVLVDVYGNDWDKFVNHANIVIFQPVYGIESWKKLYKYRVQLNMMRVHNLNSHNMRSFEVPGIGGIMIAPNTQEHQLFFKEGKEIFLYNNAIDCAEKIQYILNLSAEKALEIRQNARKRSVNDGYSYESRALQLKKMLEEING